MGSDYSSKVAILSEQWDTSRASLAAMEEAAPLAFNVSVPSDGLQGRSDVGETHPCTSGWTVARRRGEGMFCGAPEAWASRHATWALAALPRAAPRGCSTRCCARAPEGRRRTRRCVGGFTSCCSVRRGAGRGWRSTTCPPPADDELERAGLGWLIGGFP